MHHRSLPADPLSSSSLFSISFWPQAKHRCPNPLVADSNPVGVGLFIDRPVHPLFFVFRRRGTSILNLGRSQITSSGAEPCHAGMPFLERRNRTAATVRFNRTAMSASGAVPNIASSPGRQSGAARRTLKMCRFGPVPMMGIRRGSGGADGDGGWAFMESRMITRAASLRGAQSTRCRFRPDARPHDRPAGHGR